MAAGPDSCNGTTTVATSRSCTIRDMVDTRYASCQDRDEGLHFTLLPNGYREIDTDSRQLDREHAAFCSRVSI